jgi:hypothetical protein
MRHWVILVLLTCLTARTHAQSSQSLGRSAVGSDSVPLSVREAESKGDRSPRAIRNNVDSLSREIVGGTGDRRCVDVDKMNIVRSGDFVAGPFSSYNDEWRGGYGKIWWQPAVVAAPSAPLTVSAARLDAVAETRVFEQPTLAYTIDHSGKRTGAQFYPSGFRVPSRGRWLLVASAGENWGCFIVTVR